MRALLIPVLLALIAGGAGALFVLWWRERKKPGFGDEQQLRRILSMTGPARCVHAARLLQDVAGSGSTQRIAKVFDGLEGPLLEALPDCPPDYKAEIIAALDLCARTCKDAVTTRKIVALRNSLMS
jgi:hypothetical protein